MVNEAGICPDCGQPVRHIRQMCPAIVPPPTPTGDRTYVASPVTGLIYGSPDLWRDATFAFQTWLDAQHDGRGLTKSAYYSFHLVPTDKVPSWARDLTPGESVDVASRRQS